MHRIDSTVISPSSTALATLGEFGLIARIASGTRSGAGVVTGIGDDAAVTALSPGMQLLTSTDMLLEDVHFRRRWHDPYRLGRKSLAVSISDIAAMGGIPRWALLSLAIPPDIHLDFVDEFMRGFLAMASEHAVTLIGGDTCSSRSGVTVSVTLLGEQLPEQIIRRSGALPDDDIWVTGTLGDAALGLRLVEGLTVCSSDPREPVVEEAGPLLHRLLDPVPQVIAALALAEAGVATAMIDVSDGILADFGHIAEQSGVGGCLILDDLPLSPDFCSHTARLSTVPYQLVLSGGEDYELCFTAQPACREKIVDCMKKCGIAVTRVGIVTRSPGVTAVNRDGSQHIAQTEGFDHFT